MLRSVSELKTAAVDVPLSNRRHLFLSFVNAPMVVHAGSSESFAKESMHDATVTHVYVTFSPLIEGFVLRVDVAWTFPALLAKLKTQTCWS